MYAKNFIALAFLAVFCTMTAAVTAQDRIPWITDLEQARQTAIRQHRLVLLHFWREDCPPCRQLERGAFSQPEFIRALTTGYIPVKINAQTNPKLVEWYKITDVPTDVIVTPEGREIQRFTSKQDANQYIAVLDGIRAKAGVGIYEANTQLANTALQNDSQLPPRRSANSGYDTNQFPNRLNDGTTSQPANPAGRYSNPYGEQAASSDAANSRWGPARDPSPPMDNRHVAGNIDGGPRANPLDSQYQFGGQSQTQQPPAQPVRQPQENRFATNPTNNVSPADQYRFTNNNSQTQQAPVQQQRPAPSQPASNPSARVLEGFCAVTLIQNKDWQKGDPRWGAQHNGLIYLFTGPQQQQMFLANPDLYAPLLSGYDPVKYLETGQLVPGKREFGLYVVEPGPIALFSDEASLQRFESNPNHYTNMLRQAQLQQQQQRR